MTWTYSSSLASERDLIRLYVGDIDTNDQLLSDEEIDGMLLIYETPLLTAAALADGLAAKFSRSVTFQAEGLRIENSVKAENYRKLAAILRLRSDQDESASVDLGVPFIGGISDGEIRSVNSDTDRTPSRFTMGMHEAVDTSPEIE